MEQDRNTNRSTSNRESEDSSFKTSSAKWTTEQLHDFYPQRLQSKEVSNVSNLI